MSVGLNGAQSFSYCYNLQITDVLVRINVHACYSCCLV